MPLFITLSRMKYRLGKHGPYSFILIFTAAQQQFWLSHYWVNFYFHYKYFFFYSGCFFLFSSSSFFHCLKGWPFAFWHFPFSFFVIILCESSNRRISKCRVMEVWKYLLLLYKFCLLLIKEIKTAQKMIIIRYLIWYW